MVRSMTAFARAERNGISWEIRSVNQRYLDVNFKLPDPFRCIEHKLRSDVKARLYRGKVDCILRFESTGEFVPELNPDLDTVHALKNAIDHVARETGISPNVSPLEILRWPGVVRDEIAATDELLETTESVLREALDALNDMREREGEELAQFVGSRLGELETIVNTARDEAPRINKRLEARLRERLDALQTEIDKGRLEQELIYAAQKADILEELDRLDTHIAEIRGTLQQSGPVGRRLDFLMQELNREANTLSSKAVVAKTSLQAVELKVLIEQMREQIQNIE